MKHFISIHTYSNNTAHSPSMEFKEIGYMNEKEVNELESRLHGYLSNVVLFRSKKEFEETMKQFDAEYWERRL